jgi:hypothetical protein
VDGSLLFEQKLNVIVAFHQSNPFSGRIYEQRGTRGTRWRRVCKKRDLPFVRKPKKKREGETRCGLEGKENKMKQKRKMFRVGTKQTRTPL